MLLAIPLLMLLSVPAAAQFKDWPPMPEKAMQLMMKGDVPGCVELLRKQAESGDAVSMFWLGRSLEEVQGVQHDYPAAMSWYRKAAAAGIGVAAWSAGRLHEMGRGTPIDLAEARKWYAQAAGLGFHRTALTILKLQWVPGPAALTYQPAPAAVQNPTPHPSAEMIFLNQPAPNLNPEELDLLRKAGLKGKLIWSGGEPGLFGLPARLILIASKPVTTPVALPVPSAGTLIYVQNDGKWVSHGDGKPAARNVLIQPQSPGMPWITSISLELEDGGTQGGLAWSWPRN